MTARKIKLPLHRWHQLVKALRNLQPKLVAFEGDFCAKCVKVIEESTAGQFGTKAFAIKRPKASWDALCAFGLRHGVYVADVYKQTLPKPVKPEVDTVDPEDLKIAKEEMDAMDEAEVN